MKLQKEPIHINAKKADIAPVVLMPGDPLRAKYIAENFLFDAKLVTSVRNMLGYTGYYKGNRITVMGSGMGLPSMGIYCFELFYYYNVQKIIPNQYSLMLVLQYHHYLILRIRLVKMINYF